MGAVDAVQLSKTALFRGAAPREVEEMLACLGGRRRSFAKGETIYRTGEVVNVGLPSITDTIQAVPEDMAISDDGKTLTFTCIVDERSTGQQTGAYHYTITLDTGAISFEVTGQ